MKLKYFLKLKFTLILLMLMGEAFAQPPVKIEHYSTEDGLSHDIITCMYKDSQGYMWFGTWNGINRFDGHNFTSFTSSPGQVSQIKNVRIEQIFEDQANHLWVKSYDGEVYRFDKGTERFTSLSSILSLQKKMIFDRILMVADGKLWVSTINKGVLVVDDVSLAYSTCQIFANVIDPKTRLSSDKIKFIFRENKLSYWVGSSNGLLHIFSKGNTRFSSQVMNTGGKPGEEFSAVAANQGELYFGTANGDLVVLDKRSGSHHRVRVSNGRINGMLLAKKTGDVHVTTALGELISFDPRHGSMSSYNYGQQVGLFSIFEDRRGDLWIEPQQKGVIRFDIQNKTFSTFLQRNDTFNSTIPNNHYRVFEDKNGTVWSILRDGGFGYFDHKTNKFNYFYNEPGTAQRRISNITFGSFYDSAGIIWLHTDQRGLEKIIFHPNDFKQSLVVNPGLFKSQNEVRGLLSDNHNRLWVGAKSGLLYIYENGMPANITFENGSKDRIGMVYTVIQARNGVIWLGTKENGLFKAEPLNASHTNYRLTHYATEQNNPNSISSNQVYSIAEDNQGKIWVGTFDYGLNMIDPQKGDRIFKRFYDKSNGYPTLFHKIRHLAFDARGRLWIGSTDGLVIGTPVGTNNMKFSTYTKQSDDLHSLGNNDIQFILKDHLNRMWLATSGGGLNLAIEKTGSQSLKFNVYSTKNGLGNNYILSCIEDNQNRIWIATKSTLTRFDPTKGKFDNFNSYDGVPTDGFSEASCQLTRDGKLVFGTIKGILSFDPTQIKYHAIHANLAFTGLQVNNEDVTIGGEESLLQKNINYTKELKLRYNENTISVDYTVLDFRSVDRQSYMYRMKGLDTTWHDNKNQRRATYTNLPPGEYLLEVKSPDLDNYTTIPAKELKITILPPPWKTWWAYLIYFLLFCIAIAVTRRIVFTMLRLRQGIAIEQKMTALKMTFFTNVSHELRTPLTLIVNPIEELLQQEKLTEQGREYATIVSRNATRMVRFVNQLLDLRKAQSGQSKLNLSKIELKSFIQEVAENFQEAARANHITLEVISDESIEVLADADKMETVIYNLLSNSFKFSPAGKRIEVNMVKAANAIQIVVNDEGCGVNEDDLENIFLLYHESEHPDTQQLKGSGIGLALAKELVELHNGTISAVNREQQGLSITISLPLIASHVAKAEKEKVKISTTTSIGLQVQNNNEPAEEIKENEKQLILLVEDNEDMRSFLAINLSSTYRVKTAEDGLQGLAMAKKIQPDLILSDIMMPKMDGIEMLDQLKNDQETSHIPVILLSAKSALESQITGLKYGADYYISKPFDNELLFAAMENILDQRKRVFGQFVSKQKVMDLGPSQIVVTSKDELFLQKIITIVEEHMTDPKFNIDAVAETVNMARATFFKKFKSLTQQAPVEFIRDMRLKRAKQYLDAGMGNITEIAYTVGFSSAKYFSTCFRTLYGISPSDYLKSIHLDEKDNA
ncbi:hybrid sensor histidine kinase/response regulator [Pedobacter frigiditerrae]|uniref:histidine kinase n=1 Tax=Pedobacter frigiditerrae TaxID=2530452 RepID=A0A4R0MTU0_9SPHI|nr:hybrid sensor histidine kinase/response regulator transcription factor [Pedobacter frigiditerrae]TCC90203.1 hybrid sensor histidine kinase/response regulator [Pedobacter frigiditerrae]